MVAQLHDVPACAGERDAPQERQMRAEPLDSTRGIEKTGSDCPFWLRGNVVLDLLLEAPDP
jgi:hypothetical protein